MDWIRLADLGRKEGIHGNDDGKGDFAEIGCLFYDTQQPGQTAFFLYHLRRTFFL